MPSIRDYLKKGPYISLILMALNIVVAGKGIYLKSRSEGEMGYRHREMRAIEERHVYRLAWEDPETFRLPLDSLRLAIAQGRVIPETDPDFLIWLSHYQHHQSAREASPEISWGLRPTAFRPINILTHIFIHLNLGHLILNLILIWVAGYNLERAWPSYLYLAAYLLSGVFSGLIVLLARPSGPGILSGATGAASGLMGALIVSHFAVRVELGPGFRLPGLDLPGGLKWRSFWLLPIWASLAVPGAILGWRPGLNFWPPLSGLVFGGALALAAKLLRWEKLPLDPEMETRKLKRQASARLTKACQLLEAGDELAARAILQQMVNQDPQNIDAALSLARLADAGGNQAGAVRFYVQAIEAAIDRDPQRALPLFSEIKEHNYEGRLSQRTMYTIAGMLERDGQHQEAAVLYHLLVVQYPKAMVRPKALSRLYRLYRDVFGDGERAQKIREQLQQEHPDFPWQENEE